MPVPVPAYRQHKPSAQAVVTLNGRDFYLGAWDSPESRQQYDRLIAEWLANSRQLPDAVPLGELTVVELADAFLEFAKTYYVRDSQTTKEFVAMADLLKLVVQTRATLDAPTVASKATLPCVATDDRLPRYPGMDLCFHPFPGPFGGRSRRQRPSPVRHSSCIVSWDLARRRMGMNSEQSPVVRQAVAKGLSYCLASDAQLSELQAFTDDLAGRGWSPKLIAQVERGILVALFGCHTADRLTEHRDNVMA